MVKNTRNLLNQNPNLASTKPVIDKNGSLELVMVTASVIDQILCGSHGSTTEAAEIQGRQQDRAGVAICNGGGNHHFPHRYNQDEASITQHIPLNDSPNLSISGRRRHRPK